MKKLVQFGAGKIGRSFIAQVFAQSGYEIVFIDINKEVIDALNKLNTYNVVIKGETTEQIIVNNVRGVIATDSESIVSEIADADILAISIGKNAIPYIVKTLADGLLERQNKNKNSPLDIILAENMKNISKFLSKELSKHLPSNYPIKSLVGLVETSIGKMVPIMSKKDVEENVLQVFAEPYNSLIVDGKAFINPIPDVKNLAPKNNIAAWVDRKLFIHNFGHAAAAYYGYLANPDAIYIYEVLANTKVYKFVKSAMQQSASILLKMYPNDFSQDQLSSHIDDLLFRFQNKALGDTVFRVGCDLNRKLSADDRIVYPLNIGRGLNMPTDKLLQVLVYGIYFRAKDEKGLYFKNDEHFFNQYNNNIKKIMLEVCKFNEDNDASVIEDSMLISNNII